MDPKRLKFLYFSLFWALGDALISAFGCFFWIIEFLGALLFQDLRKTLYFPCKFYHLGAVTREFSASDPYNWYFRRYSLCARWILSSFDATGLLAIQVSFFWLYNRPYFCIWTHGTIQLNTTTKNILSKITIILQIHIKIPFFLLLNLLLEIAPSGNPPISPKWTFRIVSPLESASSF